METKTKIIIWISALVICAPLCGISIWADHTEDVAMQEQLDEVQTKLQEELLLNSNCNHHVDSLVYINGELSKFKSLTMAMVHRDDATRELKYGVGDIVFLKIDSSRVVIEDVLIGGGKYNYFIKYKVLYKNGQREELTPEMVY